MTKNEQVVFIIDDDERIREALSDLLESHGTPSLAFGSAREYMDARKPDLPACLVLDIELPDINGLDLQGQMAEGDHPPIVFITGHGDIPSSVRAMKRGAVDFLTKPFRDSDLMNAVRSAIAQDREARAARADLTVLKQRYRHLTPREREVLPLVVSGLLNKQAAAELGISEVTPPDPPSQGDAEDGGRVPRRARPVRRKAPDPRDAFSPNGGPMTQRARHVVAVVDDDPKILESLGDLLESAGYDVQVHTSGISLLASSVSTIDCLITDIGMPAMDGFELRNRVKQARPELPVLLISGQRDLTDVPPGGSNEQPAFFRKPFDGPALLTAIGKALHRAAG